MQTPSYPKKPKDSDPSTITELLEHRRLSFMVQRARHLIALEDLLKQYLPDSLQNQVKIMNINFDQLVLAVTSGAVATALRFYHVSVLEGVRLQSRYHQVKKIITKVRPQLFE